MPDLLSEDEITTAVAGLDGWEFRDGKLHRSWERKGFNGAIQLANVIAYVANEMTSPCTTTTRSPSPRCHTTPAASPTTTSSWHVGSNTLSTSEQSRKSKDPVPRCCPAVPSMTS